MHICKLLLVSPLSLVFILGCSDAPTPNNVAADNIGANGEQPGDPTRIIC